MRIDALAGLSAVLLIASAPAHAVPADPVCTADGEPRLRGLGDTLRTAARFEAPASGTITLSPELCDAPGRHVPDGQIPTPSDLALDAYCAELIVSRVAPRGMITIFGSARLNEGTPEYECAREFAHDWTKRRPDLPIVTGGGPGIMEAGNRGAMEAGGKSVGFATYFGASGVEKPNEYTTDGYMFADFAVRERALLKYSKAIVVYPGGFGTAWELFQTLSEMQTGKIPKMPVVLVGREFWQPVLDTMTRMLANRTISDADPSLLTLVDCDDDLVQILNRGMAPPLPRVGTVGAPPANPLRSQLASTLASTHTHVMPWSEAKDWIYSHYDDGTGNVWDAYGQTYLRGPKLGVDDKLVNVEHTWPQSHFDGWANEHAVGENVKKALRGDLHNLFPTAEVLNTDRANKPFAEIGDCPSGQSCSRDDAFEPLDAQKGDAARATFYMAVRYGFAVPDEMEKTLRSWDALDPPDASEIRRNDAIAAVQGNRNPFIDQPGLVARLGDL